MAIIAALASASPHYGVVSQSIRSVGTLAEFSRAGELLRYLKSANVSAVVLTAAHDAQGGRVLETTIALRDAHPLLWIFLVARPGAGGMRPLLDLASVALRVVCLTASLITLQRTLSRAVTTATWNIAPLEIELLFATYASRRVRRVLAHAAQGTRRTLLPRDMSAELGIPARTLRGILARAGWPPPRELISWCRLLHAAFLLDVLETPAKQAAASLGYPSASALHVAIRRHFVESTQAVIERGGYSHLLERFATRLRALGARW
ncbi:MAG: helix-turn-helix domain-containing protein [Gemmatimonadales bacterium]